MLLVYQLMDSYQCYQIIKYHQRMYSTCVKKIMVISIIITFEITVIQNNLKGQQISMQSQTSICR